MSAVVRTALVGVGAFMLSCFVGFLLLTATGGAGSLEATMMVVLALIIGVSVAVVDHRRASSRVTDGS